MPTNDSSKDPRQGELKFDDPQTPKKVSAPWNPLAGMTEAQFKEARLAAEKPRLPVPVVFPVND